MRRSQKKSKDAPPESFTQHAQKIHHEDTHQSGRQILYTETTHGSQNQNDSLETKGCVFFYQHDNRDDIAMVNVADGKRFIGIRRFLKDAFLPRGFPDSVSQDYVEYQIWDTLQAFCSAITGTLATHATLQGLGVGSSDASAMSATMTYLMKDGTGMLGRILFTWSKGTDLDNNAKKWRMVADVLNDCAIFVEIVAPAFPAYFLLLNCCSSVAKSIVGVAGGATRAAMTQHQARSNNAADVSAKDGSQETLVNLTALLGSFMIVNFVAGDTFRTWMLFIFFTAMHIYSNYRAVSSLMLDQFNSERLEIAIEKFINKKKVPTPAEMSKLEPIFPAANQDAAIKFGARFSTAFSSVDAFQAAVGSSDAKHIVFPQIKDGKSSPLQLFVYLHYTSDIDDVFRAVFECMVLRLAFSSAHRGTECDLPQSVVAATETFLASSGGLNELRLLRQKTDMYSKENVQDFLMSSRLQGWRIDKNLLDTGAYRGIWTVADS